MASRNLGVCIGVCFVLCVGVVRVVVGVYMCVSVFSVFVLNVSLWSSGRFLELTL